MVIRYYYYKGTNMGKYYLIYLHAQFKKNIMETAFVLTTTSRHNKLQIKNSLDIHTNVCNVTYKSQKGKKI